MPCVYTPIIEWDPDRARGCPYDYEIKDGRVIVEGEDMGSVRDFFDAGEKIRSVVLLWHEIAKTT